MTNATVFDAKAWEWNKDSLTIMEMQAAELQALCTRSNLKPAKTGKAAAVAAIVNYVIIPLITLVVTTLTTMFCHDYSRKKYSLESSETHGNFIKCHMSQFF
jgi:hypothetical protein